MKRNFKLEDLDCANCAAKMEAAINKIPNVSCTITFMTQRLTFEAPDAEFEKLLDEAQAAITKVEPDCKIVRR